MHKGTKHLGKTPAAQRQFRDAQRQMKTLQERLNKAILEEDFEQAAQLRDEIKRFQVKPGEPAKA